MAFSFAPQQPQQQKPSPFQQSQSPFQQTSTPPFQQSMFPQVQPQQQQVQPQQQQNQFFLFTKEKAPASYGTKWDDLHPDSQKFLLTVEERILEYRDESQRLDQCSRLYDSSVSNEGFEFDASHIVQELGGISTAMDRQKVTLHELMVVVKDMLRDTEIAVRSFMMLRPRFVRPNISSAPNALITSQAPGGAPTTTSGQSSTTAMVPVFDFYSGLPRKPSPFLQQTVARFEKDLCECRQWIEELEQLLANSNWNSVNSSSSLLQSLPKVMSNVHDFFVHVAAKVESIHQYIESMKTAYLADQRRRGDGNDPFLEADRRGTAKQAAAARRVHPTQHLPANSQPSTQVAGLLASSATPSVSAAVPASGAAPSASSGSGFSLFPTPSSASSTLGLFSTPTNSAPSSSLFGPTGASPQLGLFGTLASATPSPAPLSISMPSGGASTFLTPSASGPAAGSGASFNTLSKSRGKSRTSRR